MFVIHIQNYSGYMYTSICQTPKGFLSFMLFMIECITKYFASYPSYSVV